MKRKVLSLLIMLLLIFRTTPVLSQAAVTDGPITEYITSYNDNDYFDLSIDGDSLTVGGVCSGHDINWLWVHIAGNSTDQFKIDQVKYFSKTFRLSSYENNGSINVEISWGEQEYGTYHSIFWGPDITLNCISGVWSFCINQTVLDNNSEKFGQWFNPGDALSSQNSDIISLSNSMVEGAKSDYEKLLRIHNWVADHIYYDYDYYRGKSTNISLAPSDILLTKRTVCAGYANLMQALIQAQDIPCRIVHGYALGVSTSGVWTDEAVKTATTNHSWNEAWANGHWVIIDATWDSDNRYMDGIYHDGGVRYPKYFDISEKQLAQDHKIIDRGYTSDQNIPADWAQGEIKQALSLNLIPYSMQRAYSSNIKRSEFCSLIVKLIEAKYNAGIDGVLAQKGLSIHDSVFTDCTDTDVLSAYALGIVGGKGGSIFDPGGEITRQEAAVMLQKTAEVLGMAKSDGEIIHFTDNRTFASWAASSIGFISSVVDKTNNKPVMGETGGNHFSPCATYTREQTYCTVLRLYHAL